MISLLKEKKRTVNKLLETKLILSGHIELDPLKAIVYNCFKMLEDEYAACFDRLQTEFQERRGVLVNVEKILNFTKRRIEKPMLKMLSRIDKHDFLFYSEELHPKILTFIVKHNIIVKLLYDTLQIENDDLFIEPWDSENWISVEKRILDIVL